MRLIDADRLVNEIENLNWDWKTVDGITATTVLKQTITDIRNQPTVSVTEAIKYLKTQVTPEEFSELL